MTNTIVFTQKKKLTDILQRFFAGQNTLQNEWCDTDMRYPFRDKAPSCFPLEREILAPLSKKEYYAQERVWHTSFLR
jgi:hypothetical protein